MNVIPPVRRGKANRVCWREVRSPLVESVYDVTRTGEGICPDALTPNASFPLAMNPVHLSMLAMLRYFDFCFCVATLALCVIARYDPVESVPLGMTRTPDGDDEPYPREWE